MAGVLKHHVPPSRALPCAILAVVLAAASAQAAYIITPQGTKIEGTDIRANSTGEVVLTTPQGTRTFYKGQYVRAVADKPADFDRAKQLAEAGKHDEAAQLLKDIILRYRFLEWDNQARLALAQLHMAKGDFAAAVQAFEEVLSSPEKAAEAPQVAWAYREAMLKAAQYDKLDKVLGETIMGASRADAARAQIMRGDMRKSQGHVEAAALDYLRTVVLFESERDVQAEAHFKAAQALEELRDPRAKELYRTVAGSYPNSPYAAQAKSKM